MVATLDFPRRPAAASRRSPGRRTVRRRGSTPKIPDSIFGSYIDEVLCMVKADNSRYFFSSNDIYSVYALTDSTGNVVERYMYTPYGACTVLAPDGVTVRAESLYGNPWTFTGRRLDGETGLMYFRNRMYSVDLGRFVSRDPAGYVGGMGLCGGYFIPSASDPMGLWNQSPVHNEMTRDLSAMAGFLQRWAAKIGEWDSSIDDTYNPITLGLGAEALAGMEYDFQTPYTPAQREQFRRQREIIENEISEWHFPLSPNGEVEEGSQAARAKIVSATKVCDLPAFAKGLHVFQDSYSHKGKPFRGKYGHPGNPLSADVDNPMKNPEQAKKMAAATYAEIVLFLKKCPCIDTESDGLRESVRFQVTITSVWDYNPPGYNEGSVAHYWTRPPLPPPPYPPQYPPYSEKPPYVRTGEEMQQDFENRQGMRGGQTPRP